MKAYVDKTLDTNNDIENIVVVETNGAVMVEKFKKRLKNACKKHIALNKYIYKILKQLH